jgi:hypothetical protein
VGIDKHPRIITEAKAVEEGASRSKPLTYWMKGEKR